MPSTITNLDFFGFIVDTGSTQLSIDIQSSSSPKKKQAKLAEPQPEDYVLMKEETINVDNTTK